jgi:competence protein ComEC
VLDCGDSHDDSWNHILYHHLQAIQNVYLMIAPHHGRDSGRDFTFLDYVKPRVTLFRVAPSEHLSYSERKRRNLFYLTNNQANCIIADMNVYPVQLYLTNYAFARTLSQNPQFNAAFNAWGAGYIG